MIRLVSRQQIEKWKRTSPISWWLWHCLQLQLAGGCVSSLWMHSGYAVIHKEWPRPPVCVHGHIFSTVLFVCIVGCKCRGKASIMKTSLTKFLVCPLYDLANNSWENKTVIAGTPLSILLSSGGSLAELYPGLIYPCSRQLIDDLGLFGDFGHSYEQTTVNGLLAVLLVSFHHKLQ